MRYSREEKTMWVEDWRQSGKSPRSYARENGLNPQTFARWTAPEAEDGGCFVEVRPELPLPVQPESPARMLIEKGDVRIHIPLSAGRAELRTACGVLRRIFGGSQ